MVEKKVLEEAIYKSIKAIKPKVKDIVTDTRIVTDLEFESIDIIDLFFEIQSHTNIEIDLNEIAANIGNFEGRRFDDIKVSDILTYLESKS